MRKTTLLAVLPALLCTSSLYAQISDGHFNHSGQVKSIAVTRSELNNPSVQVNATKLYDKSGKMLQEIIGNQTTEYWYLEKQRMPAISSNRGTQDFEVNTFYPDGRLHLKGRVENGVVISLQIHSYPVGSEQVVDVRNGKTHTKTGSKTTKMHASTFPKDVIPFTWDKSRSHKIESTEQSFSNPDLKNAPEKMITYKFFESGRATNWVELVFMGPEQEMGSWYRFQNGRMVEEKYFVSKQLSGVGQRITYDAFGNISRIEHSSRDGAKDIITFSYTWDDKNNWTTSTSSADNGVGSRITRKIIYYKPGDPEIKSVLNLAKYQQLSRKLQTVAARFK